MTPWEKIKALHKEYRSHYSPHYNNNGKDHEYRSIASVLADACEEIGLHYDAAMFRWRANGSNSADRPNFSPSNSHVFGLILKDSIHPTCASCGIPYRWEQLPIVGTHINSEIMLEHRKCTCGNIIAKEAT